MSGVQIVRENIRSVGVIYFSAQLEQMRLFDVVDRIVQAFVSGLLPIDAGGGGRALDCYYWSAATRLSSAGRANLYARVLGAPGGDSSSEVEPNSDFAEIWVRFLRALNEFGRAMAEAPGRPDLPETMEHVRNAGREVAANASLYGAGYPYFAARRLSNDIRSANLLLKLPAVQRAYGAANANQLIERVAGSSDVRRYRTLAESGKVIFNVCARNSTKWTRPPHRPLFRIAGRTDRTCPDISDGDRDTLVRSAEQLLAVAGARND